jgi:6-phosphogluconate dehydrogenase
VFVAQLALFFSSNVFVITRTHPKTMQHGQTSKFVMFYQIIQFLRKVNRSTSDQYLINTQFGSQGENHVRTILEILNKLDNIVQTGECVYIYTDTQ